MNNIKSYVNYYKDEFINMINEVRNENTRYKQIPNLLTLSRGITPLITIPLILNNHVIEATIITSIEASTDFFDGKIARKYNIVSPFGKDLDAICDKLFEGGILFPLIIKNFKYGVIISIEALISLINTISKLNNNNLNSSILGKIKTTSLSITMIMSYMSLIKTNKLKNKYLDLLINFTITLQILSFVDYYLKSKNKTKKMVK